MTKLSDGLVQAPVFKKLAVADRAELIRINRSEFVFTDRKKLEELAGEAS